ncbi:MAG: 50S ribosomal protein L18 [Defluviitaleaceae bacterium]|nr:50S ribosomal protein L18 [Defluviitaleaceae bacterium]MCL2836671.1 50S ribosomal protein L18 [Defluviitaleaceae bacterium]
MIIKPNRNDARKKRHLRIRKKISGSPSKPRLSVFRSNMHIYAQIIDDTKSHTLIAASTMEKEIAKPLKNTSNLEAAAAVGTAIAKKATAIGIKEVVFDRGGYLYHGKIKALADAAREGGLVF